MKVESGFIRNNDRIAVLSEDGRPARVPTAWRPVLEDCDVLVAIPDMHMFLYDSQLDNFKFGADTFLHFLHYLAELRDVLSVEGKRLRIIQLGDMYELRFPSPSTGRRVDAREIRSSHPVYDAIVRMLRKLDIRFIYGNHDFENRNHPEIDFQAREGKVHLEHGFTADSWYHFANPFLPFWHTAMRFLHELRRVEQSFHSVRAAVGIKSALDTVALGVTSGYEERDRITERHEYPRRQLAHYSEVLNSDTATGPTPKVCIIGHTHRPYFDPNPGGANCFFLDAGAWTDGRSDFAVVTNEEVAICRYRRLPGFAARYRSILNARTRSFISSPAIASTN